MSSFNLLFAVALLLFGLFQPLIENRMALDKTGLYSEDGRSAREAVRGCMIDGTKDFALRDTGRVSGSADCPEVGADQILKILGTVAISTNADVMKVAEALTAQLREVSGGDNVVEITRFRIGNVTYFPYETK